MADPQLKDYNLLQAKISAEADHFYFNHWGQFGGNEISLIRNWSDWLTRQWKPYTLYQPKQASPGPGPTYLHLSTEEWSSEVRMTQWNKNLELRAVLCEMWELNIISLRRIIYCIYTLHLLLWTWHVILQSDTDSLLWQPSGAKLPTNSLLFN